ncbi:MAG: hypothetical protein E6I64_07120 [Chloroflexi bacterium]|nr:MAG: hypothetical protein E6I64_07120 [Chloroflexota bacterium]
MLIAPSQPLSARAARLLEGMRAAFGGEVVDPLHVTIDRVATADAAALVRAIRLAMPNLRSAPVRVSRIFLIDSRDRGPRIVKLDVVPDRVLAESSAALRSAMRSLGLPSLHREDRSPSISALQRVGPFALADADAFGLPIDLFVGDRVLVSRIRGPAAYEILDSAPMP